MGHKASKMMDFWDDEGEPASDWRKWAVGIVCGAALAAIVALCYKGKLNDAKPELKPGSSLYLPAQRYCECSGQYKKYI